MLKAGANNRSAIDDHSVGTDKTGTIRSLNDALRQSLPFTGKRGRLIITDGVALLGIERMTELLMNVRDYSDFDPGNDPHGEHDFGKVEVGESSYLWKIDYFDGSMCHGSNGSTDQTATVRVITIMRSDEY
jgi:hypothetical protein